MQSVLTRFADILTRLTTTNGVAIDDHQEDKTKIFDKIAIIKAIAIKGLFVVNVDPETKESYSMNELYVGNDGMVHIGHMSAGVVHAGNFKASVENITAIAFIKQVNVNSK